MGRDALDVLLSWAATYAIHSTILLGVTWLLLARGPSRVRSAGAATREVLWGAAIGGALLTATLHAAFGPPLGRAIDLRRPAREEASRLPAIGRPAPAGREPGAEGGAAPLLPAGAPPPNPGATPAAAPAWPRGLSLGLAVAWLLGAGFGLLRERVLHRRLARGLRGRVPVERPDVRDAFTRLLAEAGLRRPVRLTVHADLAGPISFGVRRPEICLPERAVAELPEAEREALLAHEVAHVLRRDPLRLRLRRLVVAVLWFQPLHRVAAERLREAAEVLCDAWAARTPARRRALADCLVRVASWAAGLPAPVPAMVGTRSALGRRIDLLIEGADGTARSAGPAARGLAVAMVALVAGFAPAFGAPASPGGRATAPAAAPAPSEADPFAELEADVRALEAEAAAVRDLLRAAGRGDLAARIAGRLEGVRARRDRLRAAVGTGRR